MLLRRLTVAAIGIVLGTGLLLPTAVVAAKNEAYYTTQKISDYKKGEFGVLVDDDVNFRNGPSTTSMVLACLPRHSLLRIIDKQDGEWQKIEWNGKVGYIFARYLNLPSAEALIDEDNSLGDLQLGQKFEPNVVKSFGKIKKESKDGSLQVYDFQQLQIKVKRGTKKMEEITTSSPVIYTMRGIGAGDKEARVVGQYGIPARVIYLYSDKKAAKDKRSKKQDNQNEEFMIYGYDFPDDSKTGRRLNFYINTEGDVSRIVLSKFA